MAEINNVSLGHAADEKPGAALLKRGDLALEDGDFTAAEAFYEQALNSEPENAYAYFGKLMAQLKVRKKSELAAREFPFDGNLNYQKALRFADEGLKKELEGYIETINGRIETARKEEIYNEALVEMSANTESGYRSAAKTFQTIPGWKDADALAAQCMEKAEECRAKEAADRLEAERIAEQRRVAAEKSAKKRKKIAAVVTPIVVVSIAFLIVLTKVIIPNGKYNSAVDLYNAGKYDEAIAAFQALNGYKDSTEQIAKCETAVKDEQYNAALDLYNAGKYNEAITAFQVLNGYKDSAEKAAEILFSKQKAALTDVSVGSTIKFGSYEQDNNTSNGKEEIEWIVLAKEDDKVLVISKYALDCQQYNTSQTDVTWATCSLRTWLNGTFYYAAFGTDHQKLIISSTVTADKNPSYSTSPGGNTTDKVFLLSITEVKKYFGSNSARQCQGTAYCYAQGANKADSGFCWWWLRSPGSYSNVAALVDCDGFVSYRGKYVDRGNVAVRPALWINLGS